MNSNRRPGPGEGSYVLAVPPTRVRRVSGYGGAVAARAASVGVGLEYFLNRHISVALGIPLMIYPDWDTSLQQRSNSGAPVGQPVKSSWNYTGISPNVRITAYVPSERAPIPGINAGSATPTTHTASPAW
jgi:hypothetical protein